MSLFSIIFVKPQDDYHPMWPQWARWLGWAVRNPFPGLVPPLQTPLIVFQVLAHDTVLLSQPVPTFKPGGGYWKLNVHTMLTVHTINISSGKLFRRFRSYRGKWIEWYFGWKPHNGSFGMAFRKANSKGF
jgi:hypothetical protein